MKYLPERKFHWNGNRSVEVNCEQILYQRAVYLKYCFRYLSEKPRHSPDHLRNPISHVYHHLRTQALSFFQKPYQKDVSCHHLEIP